MPNSGIVSDSRDSRDSVLARVVGQNVGCWWRAEMQVRMLMQMLMPMLMLRPCDACDLFEKLATCNIYSYEVAWRRRDGVPLSCCRI
jgi:hypothetical protein